jgi:hypothetical protein
MKVAPVGTLMIILEIVEDIVPAYVVVRGARGRFDSRQTVIDEAVHLLQLVVCFLLDLVLSYLLPLLTLSLFCRV